MGGSILIPNLTYPKISIILLFQQSSKATFYQNFAEGMVVIDLDKVKLINYFLQFLLFIINEVGKGEKGSGVGRGRIKV